MCTTNNIDTRKCPYCNSTRTGVKNSTEETNGLRKQKRICLNCKQTYFFIFHNKKIIAALDEEGNSIIEDIEIGA